MMYQKHIRGILNQKIEHWRTDRRPRAGHNANRDFATRKDEEDAGSAFESGMAALMQGRLKKARSEFNLCMSRSPAHRQAPGHIEVVEFCSKSQQAANAAVKIMVKGGMNHSFDEKRAERLKAELARAKFDPKSAAVAFGMARAYLALEKQQNVMSWDSWAKRELDRALTILGTSRIEKYKKAAVHRIYAQVEDSEFHLALMRELDPHIPANW